MALATRCPHCQTTFRVVHDQLKLRAGLVRCGACKQIFNGVENLLPAEYPSPPSTPGVPPSPSPGVIEDNHAAGKPPEPNRPAPPSTISTQPATVASSPEGLASTPPSDSVEIVSKTSGRNVAAPSIGASAKADEDPLQRMTLMEFTESSDEDKDQANPNAASTGQPKPTEFAPSSLAAANNPPFDDLDRTIDELQRRPWRDPRKRRDKSKSRRIDNDGIDSAEPGFVKRARRQQRIGRSLRIAMAVGSIILLIGLLAQSVYLSRSQIAARMPQAAPFFTRACAIFGCRIELPAQIDMVSIESSELQALAADQNIFSLVALLRNRAPMMQAWPNLELTLNDANGKPIVRRVFIPQDYLPNLAEQAKGFAANSEQPIKITFALSQLQASGYRLYVFYP